jgi:hypothetical protein
MRVLARAARALALTPHARSSRFLARSPRALSRSLTTCARTLQVSTKPFPEGKPPASRDSSFKGRPADCFIEEGAEVTKTVVLTWERV